MARTVHTIENDMLDHLTWRETGRTAGALEKVLDANPFLAGAPVVMAAGVAVVIPDDAAAEPPRGVFKLWE